MTTHPVGQKKANPWELLDILGNVWEWCEDYYGPYTAAPKDGMAQIVKQSNDVRVLRGGSWNYSSQDCRSAGRINYAPDSRIIIIGFRVVLSPQG